MSMRKNLVAVAWLGLVATAVAQQFEIIRSTIDGGGVMRSTGGAFELSGTIGQPDAGTMVGGGFELNGGFWFPIEPTDCNEDGGINLFDYDAFEVCLSGPQGGLLGPGCSCFDVDGNQHVDLLDFAEMQSLFSGQ